MNRNPNTNRNSNIAGILVFLGVAVFAVALGVGGAEGLGQAALCAVFIGVLIVFATAISNVRL